MAIRGSRLKREKDNLPMTFPPTVQGIYLKLGFFRITSNSVGRSPEHATRLKCRVVRAGLYRENEQEGK